MHPYLNNSRQLSNVLAYLCNETGEPCFDSHDKSDLYSFFLFELANNSSLYPCALKYLHTKPDEYISTCLANSAPLLFPEAIAEAEKAGCDRSYIKTGTEPLVEAYVQNDKLYTGCVAKTSCWNINTDSNSCGRMTVDARAVKEAQNTLISIYDKYGSVLTVPEACAFIGIPYWKIPDNVITIEIDEAVWLVDQSDRISKLLFLNREKVPEDLRIFAASPLFASESKDDAENIRTRLAKENKKHYDSVWEKDGFFEP